MNHDSKEPAKAQHLGDIARRLREDAGLTRKVLGDQLNLSETVLKRFEMGKLRLSTPELQRLLRHASMVDLSKLAHAAGIEPSSGGHSGGSGSDSGADDGGSI